MWNDGSPSGTGFSTKHSALAPLSTQRRISCSPSTGSHTVVMTMGTNSPGGPAAHHSSRTKSFHALTHSYASALSLNAVKSIPPNLGRVGKQMLARTPCDR